MERVATLLEKYRNIQSLHGIEILNEQLFLFQSIGHRLAKEMSRFTSSSKKSKLDLHTSHKWWQGWHFRITELIKHCFF